MVKKEMEIKLSTNTMYIEKSSRFKECLQKDKCPYLNYRSTAEIIAERNYLSKRLEEMEKVMEMAEIKIVGLEEKVKLLEEEKQNLQEELNEAIRKPFKPNIKKGEDNNKKEGKKKGAPVGHRGGTRKKPTKIDEYIKVTHKKCHLCGSNDVINYSTFEKHIIEDIEIRVKAICYLLYYGYCYKCKKVLYPKTSSIIPNSYIGPIARAISEYLHYIGVSYKKIEKIFSDIFRLEITHPSLVGFDKKIAANGEKIYEQIKQLVRLSSSINGDETGWRVDGINHWLWGFCNKDVTLYKIEKSRGSEVVEATLGKEYGGILISDFYSSYNSIKAKAKQKCIGHLLKEIKKLEEKKLISDNNDEHLICNELKSTLKSAIELWNKFKAGEKTANELKTFKEVCAEQLTKFVTFQTENKHIRRLQKRLIKYNKEILTFLEHPEIEPTNNRAERQIRPNVILRKISFGNRSQSGAKNHSIVMSILQTTMGQQKKPLDILSSLAIKPANDLSELVNQKTRAP